MPSLVDYCGLQIVSPDPTGDGGLAIQNNFVNLVDWHPQSSWNQTANPAATDDNTEDYYPGSLWLNTSTTPPQLFVCQSSSTGDVQWLPILLGIGPVNIPGRFI